MTNANTARYPDDEVVDRYESWSELYDRLPDPASTWQRPVRDAFVAWPVCDTIPKPVPLPNPLKDRALRNAQNLQEEYENFPIIPEWQTEPPTEVGWYAALLSDKSLVERRVVVEIREKFFGGVHAIGEYVGKVGCWWPVPITMPEPPE